MKKSSCVIFLAFSHFLFAVEPQLPRESSATDYLALFNVRRSLRTERHQLEADLNTAAAEKVRAFDDATRAHKLALKGAVNDEEDRQYRMRSEVADQVFERSQQALDFNQAGIDLVEVRMTFAKGEPHDVRRLFPITQRQWEVDCRIKSIAVTEAQARVSFTEYRMKNLKKLTPSKVVTQQEYQRSETDYIRDANDLKARQAAFESCDKDLPTLEELEKLQAAGLAFLMMQ